MTDTATGEEGHLLMFTETTWWKSATAGNKACGMFWCFGLWFDLFTFRFYLLCFFKDIIMPMHFSLKPCVSLNKNVHERAVFIRVFP